jgi:DNA polymerase-4
VTDREMLRRTIHKLSEGVGQRLRESDLRGSTIKIKLRWSNFATLTRQVTLNGPTNQDIEIYTAAMQLFEKAWPAGRPVRLIGVGVSGFEPQNRQLSLLNYHAAEPEPEPLKNVLDNLREKFGDQAVQRGSDLKSRDSDNA